MSDTERDVGRPALRVVHGGDPGPDALAALVVALSSAGPRTNRKEQPRSGWTDRGALLRRPLDHGPGRWVASARGAR